MSSHYQNYNMPGMPGSKQSSKQYAQQHHPAKHHHQGYHHPRDSRNDASEVRNSMSYESRGTISKNISNDMMKDDHSLATATTDRIKYKKRSLIGIILLSILITARCFFIYEDWKPSVKTTETFHNILKQPDTSNSQGLKVLEESDNIDIDHLRGSFSTSKNESQCGVIFFYHVNKVGGRTVQGKIFGLSFFLCNASVLFC